MAKKVQDKIGGKVKPTVVQFPESQTEKPVTDYSAKIGGKVAPTVVQMPETSVQNAAYQTAMSQLSSVPYTPVQYTPSAETINYQNMLAQIEQSTPGPYQSPYGGKIGEILTKIANREPFSYDFNADPIYQQYKDQYVKLGNEASQNAAANVAALTGGFGNSYATTAASQANQQYLTALNNIIPELSSQAYDRYRQEGEDLLNLYGLYGSEEDRAYGQYRDKVGDYQAERGYYQGATQASIGNDQWAANFAQAQAEYDRAYQQWMEQFAYQQGRDAVADDQWQQSFDRAGDQWNQEMAYQQGRDAVSDSQWQQSFDRAGEQWAQELAYQQARDQVSDSQWQQSFDRAGDQWAQEMAYQQGRDAVSDSQWQQEFDYQRLRDQIGDDQWAQELAARRSSAGSGSQTQPTVISAGYAPYSDAYAQAMANLQSLAQQTNTTTSPNFALRSLIDLQTQPDYVSIARGMSNAGRSAEDIARELMNRGASSAEIALIMKGL